MGRGREGDDEYSPEERRNRKKEMRELEDKEEVTLSRAGFCMCGLCTISLYSPMIWSFCCIWMHGRRVGSELVLFCFEWPSFPFFVLIIPG